MLAPRYAVYEARLKYVTEILVINNVRQSKSTPKLKGRKIFAFQLRKFEIPTFYFIVYTHYTNKERRWMTTVRLK